MYLALSGDHLTALASEDIQKQWKAHESEYHHLVDQLTRRLSEGERTLPFRDEIIAETTGTDKPSSYRLRYVCPFFNLKGTCFSIGVREPFVNYSSPIWMRFHWQTPNFEIVQSRIKLSDVDWIESNGHLWLPLEERLGEQFNKQLDYLYDKVVSISDIVDLPQS